MTARGLNGAARLVALAALVAPVACSPPTPTAVPVPTSTVDATGILIVDVEDQVQAGPVSRRLADPYSAAMQLAETNGDDLGYVWVDPETEELVLSAVTPRGRALIDAAGIEVPYRVRDVQFGASLLRQIQDEAPFLNSRGVPGAEHIFMTLPDHRDNRTLIVISEMSRPLLDALAEIYPAGAIAVQVDPTFVGGGPG